MAMNEKHPKTDLRTISKHEEQSLIYRGHLRAFHGYVAPEGEALTSLKRRHNEEHERPR
jgi:hypothetical protein